MAVWWLKEKLSAIHLVVLMICQTAVLKGTVPHFVHTHMFAFLIMGYVLYRGTPFPMNN